MSRLGTAARWAARWLGLPMVHGVCLVGFLYLTLPTDTLRQRLVAEFNAERPASEGRLEIDTLDTWWLSGVELGGVRLVSPGPPTEDGKEGKPITLALDRVTVRVALGPLLFGTRHVDFHAEGFGGTVTGSIDDAGTTRTVDVELNGLSLAELAPLTTGALGLPLAGSLAGSVHLVAPEQKLAKSEGTAALTLEGFSAGDGKAKIRETIALPKLDVGTLTLEATITDGRLKIEKFGGSGRDLELSTEGRVRLRDPGGSSLLELTTRFKFSPKYTEQSEVTRALFGTPGSAMPGLFDMDPKMKRSKRPDGSYAWKITGPLTRLTFEPAPAAAAAAPRARGAAKPGDDDEE